MEIAEYLGFSRQQGLGLYKSVTLAGEMYGVYGLRLKPDAQRLYRWLKPDFFRKVNNMPHHLQTIKIVGWGVKAKVAIDLLSAGPTTN
ncbi:DUF4225 domain-containing protein [Yokenella regensburgei]|uniref:DUF4225 domain-containing protein n=1 Tax=Yokenella regensburgei TaxID=158877 RepID=UPI003F18FCEE